mmetsp:Transcript_30906/g.68441  ORF Transcript_30906/g.68441 Transcript_30906/m.68441 type:complete len:229 (+) Transcript_30906:164-850(+)
MRKAAYSSSLCGLGLLLLHLLHVELQLLALQDVAIAATALTGAGCNACVQPASCELLSKVSIQLALLQALLQLPLHVVGGLLVINLDWLLLALGAQLHAVVCLVPLLEGSSINLDDGVLHQSLGTDKLVVRGVVGHIQNADLAGDSLSAPGKVAVVKTQSPELVVATTHTNLPNSHVGGQLGVSRHTSHLIFLLLAPVLLATTGRPALMQRVTGDTHLGALRCTKSWR